MTTAVASEPQGDLSAMPAVLPAVLLDDDAKPQLVWIQLAECGKFSGHPAGDFELSPAVFAQICNNFKRDKRPICYRALFRIIKRCSFSFFNYQLYCWYFFS